VARPKGSKNRPKPHPHKDKVVGDGSLPEQGPTTPTSAPQYTGHGNQSLIPYHSNDVATKQISKWRDDILAMYEGGVSPRQIALRFPMYTPAQILELCQSNFDLSQITLDNLDSILMKGYLRDMVSLHELASESDSFEEKLAALTVLQTTRERAVKYRELLAPILPNKLETADEESPEAVPTIITIEERIKMKMREFRSLDERSAFLQKIEKATAEELDSILEGEFTEVENGIPST